MQSRILVLIVAFSLSDGPARDLMGAVGMQG